MDNKLQIFEILFRSSFVEFWWCKIVTLYPIFLSDTICCHCSEIKPLKIYDYLFFMSHLTNFVLLPTNFKNVFCNCHSSRERRLTTSARISPKCSTSFSTTLRLERNVLFTRIRGVSRLARSAWWSWFTRTTLVSFCRRESLLIRSVLFSSVSFWNL